MRLTFECAGQTLINRELLRVGKYAGDARPAMAAIADVMIDETKQQFASEGKHASGGWRPLAHSTVIEKARHGQRPEILRRTDALLRSLTVKGDSNQVLQIGAQSLTFGTRLPYADFHQTGTVHMPARPPLAFTEESKRRILKVLQRWIILGEVAT